MTTTRRGLLRGAAATGGALAAAAVATNPTNPTAAHAAAATPTSSDGTELDDQGRALPLVPDTGTHLVLLGTGGGPVPFPGRTGIASAVVVDGWTYLVDLGHGAFDQVGRAGLDVGRIAAAFITHLHSDHVADLWALPWLRFGGADPLGTPLHVWGPGPAGGLQPPRQDEPVRLVSPGNPTPGTADLVARAIEGSAYDLNVRMRDEGWPDIAEMVVAHDVMPPAATGADFENTCPEMEPFEVFTDERVTVTATLVEHAPVFPSYGFRFDTPHGSITVSGDTARSSNLVRLARGTDLLQHEVIDVRVLELDPTMTPERLQHLTESHTPVTEVGAVARDAGARTLVLSHLSPSTRAIPDASWLRQAQDGFDGEVHVGNDLDVLSLRQDTH